MSEIDKIAGGRLNESPVFRVDLQYRVVVDERTPPVDGNADAGT